MYKKKKKPIAKEKWLTLLGHKYLRINSAYMPVAASAICKRKFIQIRKKNQM